MCRLEKPERHNGAEWIETGEMDSDWGKWI